MANVTFEIPAHNRERAKLFYQTVFGWQTADLPEVEFTLLTAPSTPASNEGQPEIMGGLAAASPLVSAPVPIITVPSIDDACEVVKSAGGERLTERTQVGTFGWSCYIRDSEGNTLCLWETQSPE